MRSKSRSIFSNTTAPRAGNFTPLRFVPRTRSVVLGLVSTKVPELEDKAASAPAARRRDKIRRGGPARGQPAMRLRQRRYRQSDHAGGAAAQARTGLRSGARDLGRDVSRSLRSSIQKTANKCVGEKMSVKSVAADRRLSRQSWRRARLPLPLPGLCLHRPPTMPPVIRTGRCACWRPPPPAAILT